MSSGSDSSGLTSLGSSGSNFSDLGGINTLANQFGSSATGSSTGSSDAYQSIMDSIMNTNSRSLTDLTNSSFLTDLENTLSNSLTNSKYTDALKKLLGGMGTSLGSGTGSTANTLAGSGIPLSPTTGAMQARTGTNKMAYPQMDATQLARAASIIRQRMRGL